MRINEYINGIKVNDSNNIAELEIELNFDNDNNRESVSLTNFEFGVGDSRFANDAYTILKKVLNDGFNGGVGVIEGVPFLVELDNQRGVKKDLINGYIDLWSAEYQNGTIKATVVPEGGIDWLNDKIDSFSFEYLESIGLINSSHYVDIPYCINKKNYATEYFITLLTIFFVTDKIMSTIKNIKKLTIKLFNPFESSAIVGLVLEILYVVVLITSLVILVLKLFTMIIQPVKYLKAMYTKDLLEIGFNHLGLTFKSSIYQQYPFNQEVIIPERYAIPEFLGLSGNLTKNNDDKGFHNSNFGDFIRTLKTKFNAKLLIDKGVVYFEKNDFTLSSPIYQLPDILDSRYQYSLNKDDFHSNYIVSFAVDSNDKNTISEYRGTSIQVIQNAIFSNNIKMSLSKGLFEQRIAFALGKRKTSLNAMETLLDAFFKTSGAYLEGLIAVINGAISAVNALIDILNDILDVLEFFGIDLNFEMPNVPYVELKGFSNLIENRVGMLVLDNDYIEVPKNILINSDGKLMNGNETYLSAEYLYDNFHYFQSFVGGQNQYLLKSFDKINFTFNDFQKVLNNNRIFAPNGDEAILLSLKYNPIQETATGTFKVKTIYLTNLKETKLIPDGK
jgi:hypothetical protein